METGAASGDAKRKVVFVAGEDSHGPKAHEHAAGTRLLAEELRERYGDIDTVSVIGAWPEDETVFEDADALVLYCDGGKGHLINDHLERFNAMVEAGVGIAAIHYCVEVPKGSPSADAMLDAIGGYFETWWSVNPHWTARFSALPAHPIVQGVTSFSTLDEWYFNMRFREGVIPILSAVPPESTMERRNGPHSGNDAVRKQVADGVPQVVAWAYERPGGGRGFGYTGGHFHANWADDNARNTVLNAINWVAGAGDVP
ncbi:MAG: ThuA domain-containing protein [Pseudomonadota bacterium]